MNDSVDMPDLANNSNVPLSYTLKVTYTAAGSGRYVAINYPCNLAPKQSAPAPGGTLYFNLQCIDDTTGVEITAVLQNSDGSQVYADAVRTGINFVA
jgi:hypothetical protein